jgi:hypothetical protein
VGNVTVLADVSVAGDERVFSLETHVRVTDTAETQLDLSWPRTQLGASEESLPSEPSAAADSGFELAWNVLFQGATAVIVLNSFL